MNPFEEAKRLVRKFFLFDYRLSIVVFDGEISWKRKIKIKIKLFFFVINFLGGVKKREREREKHIRITTFSRFEMSTNDLENQVTSSC